MKDRHRLAIDRAEKLAFIRMNSSMNVHKDEELLELAALSISDEDE